MPQPKRHHSIPQFLLKRFAGPHGRLFVWRKADGKIWPTTPTDAFVEGHLYSTVDRQGQKDTTLETDYAALEGRVAPVVETIADAVANGLVPSLAVPERKAWDEFYFHQIIRISEFMEQLSTVQTFEEKAETYLTAIETRFGIKVDEAERAKIISPQGLARIKQNAKVTSLADPGDTVVGVLSRMSLEFGVSAGASRFVIGSQPVARLPVPTMEADKPYALWLPIGPTSAVRPGSGTPRGHLVLFSDSDVDAINKIVVQQSELIATDTREHLEAVCQVSGVQPSAAGVDEGGRESKAN